jgi:hypothetical protein
MARKQRIVGGDHHWRVRIETERRDVGIAKQPGDGFSAFGMGDERVDLRFSTDSGAEIDRVRTCL